MPRRKEPTYNDYARQIESLQAKMAERRERMVQILSSVLDDKAAAALGDLSDTELQKVMELIVEDISVYVDRVIANRHPRSTPKAKADTPAAPSPKTVDKPVRAVANMPTTKPTDRPVQTAVESANTRPNSGAAQPSKVPDKPLIRGELRMNVRLGKWGVWDKEADDWYLPSITTGIDFEISPNRRMWFATRTTICTQGERKGEVIFPIKANGGPAEVYCSRELPIRSILPGNSVIYERN